MPDRSPSPIKGCPLRHTKLWVSLWLLLTSPAIGIVLYDTDNPTQNTTAPTGVLADSGWQYLGLYGGFLGTAIGNNHFITAKHIGDQGGSFIQSAAFTGGPEVVHTINGAANGGIGYWDIGGTDLRVFQVDGVGFAEYAPLYTGVVEIGEGLVAFGRGGPRGAEVNVGGELKGWQHTGGDGVTRWGQNTVSSIVTLGGNSMLTSTFDAVPGINEATLSVGDSGGPVFIQDGGDWKLAGINFAVDGDFDTNNQVGDGSEFGAALFDRGGLYQGSDSTSWTFNTDLPADRPSSMYASRISSSAADIQAIVMVPEPGSGLLLISGWMIRLLRRVRPHPTQRKSTDLHSLEAPRK